LPVPSQSHLSGQARVAAVMQKKTLGQWLEEAIMEKIDREQKQNNGAPHQTLLTLSVQS